jgi:hypothetical protein
MKNFLIGLIIVIILAALGYGGWFYFIKKSPEGGKCVNASRCESGLNCVSGTCSSGKIGSMCKTHGNCQSGLLCAKQICSKQPDYSQYFDKIVISKIKPGIGPGPNNPETITTEFNAATDAIEVDLAGVKPTTIGPFYFELVNSTTGEVAVSTQNRQGEMSLNGQDRGAGTSLSGTAPGTYDFNFYFNNQLLYTTPITVK